MTIAIWYGSDLAYRVQGNIVTVGGNRSRTLTLEAGVAEEIEVLAVAASRYLTGSGQGDMTVAVGGDSRTFERTPVLPEDHRFAEPEPVKKLVRAIAAAALTQRGKAELA